MARIRTIKPSFFSSLTIAALPIQTRLTFIGLWCYVDDSGRAVDDPRLVKAEIWPLNDDISVKRVSADLRRLDEAGLIRRYEVAGRRYLVVTSWQEHQRINRPQPSRFPDPSLNGHGTSSENGVNGHGAVTDDSLWEGKGRERKGKETPLPPLPTQPEPVDTTAGEGLIDQALDIAALRYGEHEVETGQGKSLTALAKWWTNENAAAARTRASNLLESHDLTATQLADALLQPNPPWLRHHRRRPE